MQNFTGRLNLLLVVRMHNFIKSLSIISLSVFLLNTASIFAEEKVITLGGRAGWADVERKECVAETAGRYGHPGLTLDTNSRRVDSKTDLLLDFEGNRVDDVAGNYAIVSDSSIQIDSAKMGKKAGLFRGTGGIRLSGEKAALFGSSGAIGSFLIEFWLNPSVGENGERVFSWRSSRTVNNDSLYQMINASFYQNRLEWIFTNVFNGYTDNDGEIALSSYSTVIPNIWTHHSISFDSNTGLLEYRINGRIEAMRYVTNNGREIGTVYEPILGVPADIDVCSQYSGLIDDFHIQRTNESVSASDMRYDTYHREGGRFESKPIMVSKDAALTQVNANVTEPAQTDVVLYVRSGDNYFGWTDNYPEWIPVTSGKKIKNVKGLYFQVAADLFPDGTGEKSPVVNQIDLHFSEIDPPLPPFRVTAKPGDSSVTLTWSYSVDNYTGGYYIYYGDRPGEYLGREALEGESPVNVENTNSVTIHGLKNGKIYYFAIAAYSSVDESIMGVLSKEVYARPLRK